MATIPATYEESRERFRASLSTIQSLWPKAHITSTHLSDLPDLTIEVISADAQRLKQKRLILTTGLHGIEGYVGSGILQLFTKEFLPYLNPETTGFVLVHPINPFGMKHRTRVNKNSVDLNRNFNADFESLNLVNPHYESLKYLLNPSRPLKDPLYEKIAYLANVFRALLKGSSYIREAALMGQYRIHNGMYFGGFEQQEETRIMSGLFRESILDYTQVLALDIHSGYGPRWQMTLVNSPLNKLSATETVTRYNIPRVVGANPDEFYSMHGDMQDFLIELIRSDFPNTSHWVGTFEFGTYGISLWQEMHSLRTTLLENCLRWHSGKSRTRKWMENEYYELYLPTDSKWWEKAQADARQYLDRILKVEGFLD
jgi:hypothetical protein